MSFNIWNFIAKFAVEKPVNPPPPVIVEAPLVPDPVRIAKPLNQRYIGVIFTGSVFPDDPYQIFNVKLNQTVLTEYLPALERAIPKENKGLKLLMTAMVHQEFFSAGNPAKGVKPSRSYRTNNPGNVGNTDSGSNRIFKTLEEGIKAQADHLKDIADGAKYYPLGVNMTLPNFYSKEIEKNPGYGLPANLPGYRFKYTGQLDQFIKIYSTGARATNNYIDTIVNYFRQNKISISPTNTIQEIINIK
mgnify:CR=1 FL=1